MKKYEVPEISIVQVFATDIVAGTYIERRAGHLGDIGPGGSGSGIGGGEGTPETWISNWAGQASATASTGN